MAKPSSAGAVAATLAAASLFATSATARAISDVTVDSTTVATVRLLLGAAGLVVFSLAMRRGRQLLELWRRPIVWLMALGVAGYQALFFIGTGRVGVAIGTLASLALGPLMAGLLAWGISKHRPSRTWWASTLLAVVGLVVLTLGGRVGMPADIVGVLAAVGAGSAYALYTVLGARLARTGYTGVDVLSASFAIGALLLLPLGIGGIGAFESGAGIALALWLGIVATAVAYIGFGAGISRLSAGTVATLNLAEPVVATFLGVLVVKETLSAVSWAGAALIALALSILAFYAARGGES